MTDSKEDGDVIVICEGANDILTSVGSDTLMDEKDVTGEAGTLTIPIEELTEEKEMES